MPSQEYHDEQRFFEYLAAIDCLYRKLSLFAVKQLANEQKG